MSRVQQALWAGAAGIALVCIAGGAVAQDPGRGEFVRDRARPEIDPLGVRLGSFLLYPALSTGLVYNDNVFATQNNTKSDFIATVVPRFDLRSNFGRHELRLTAEAEAGRYFDNTSENYVDYNLAGTGRLDVGTEGAFTGGFGHRRAHEGRGDPDSQVNVNDRDEPILYTVTGGNAGYRQGFGRFNASIRFGADFLDFQDVERRNATTVAQDFRNRWIYQTQARLGYEILPGYEAFLRGTHTAIAYDRRDPAGFQRDSDGFEAVVGARLDITGLIVGEVFAGYLERDYDDARLKDFDGLTFGGRLDWAVTQLTTVYGIARRSVLETTRFNASSIEQTLFAVGVDHELLRQFIVDAQLRRITDVFQGVSIEDQYWRATVGGTYTFNRNMFVNAGYTYETRDSDAVGRDYDANIVTLRLGFRL